jgi:hypothetical protein
MSNIQRHMQQCKGARCTKKATRSGAGFFSCDDCIVDFAFCAKCSAIFYAMRDEDTRAENCIRCETKYGVCHFESSSTMQQPLKEIVVDEKIFVVGYMCGICSKCHKQACDMDDDSDDSEDEELTLVCVECRFDEQQDRNDGYQ